MDIIPLTGHLVKGTPDMKKWFSSLDDDYIIQGLESFIADAEMDYLVPEFGYDTVQALITGYNSDAGLSGKLAELMPYVQKAVVHFALMLSSDSGSFRISDSGYYVSSTGDKKPVSDKKMVEFRKGRWRAAYKAVEQAIDYLEANVNDAAFAAYKASDVHTRALQYFINDSITFTNFFPPLNRSAITFRKFLAALDWSERTYILPLLGDALYDDIKAGIAGSNLTDDYKKLLTLIQRPLAWYTIAKAVPNLQVEFDGSSLYINSMPTKGNSENVEEKSAATLVQITSLAEEATITATAELKRLQNFLLTNAVTYPLYVVPPVSDQGDIDMNDDPCSGIVFV